MPISLHLSQFDGPLDMLLFMVGSAKIDIRDIFVSEITDQYIAYVRQAEGLDMDEASAFIQMAARLLEIKSRSMLPKPETPEEEDPEQLLIRQLEEYAAFKRIAEEMQAFEKTAALMYEKLPEEYPLPPPSFEISGLTLAGLVNAFAEVMTRVAPDEDETTVETARRIVRDEYTVPYCMARILKMTRKGSARFSALFEKRATREEVVTLFLALLELLRLGRIACVQESAYDDILMIAIKSHKEEAPLEPSQPVQHH